MGTNIEVCAQLKYVSSSRFSCIVRRVRRVGQIAQLRVDGVLKMKDGYEFVTFIRKVNQAYRVVRRTFEEIGEIEGLRLNAKDLVHSKNGAILSIILLKDGMPGNSKWFIFLTVKMSTLRKKC